MDSPSPSAKFGLALLLAIFLLIWFGNLEHRHLVKPDEGRYSEIPREMVASGDWLTPRLNDIKYFEKPALQYWATATAYTLFGEHHWTARLWSALTGFLGILLVSLTAARLWNRETGLYAALVLGSSLLYVLIGHINTLDMGVTFFMTAGLCGFLLAQRDGASTGETKFWMLFTWASLAFSILSKGLIGLALPGAVLVLYTLIQRDWGLWKRLHLLGGLALFLLISAPWFVAVSIANPEFFHFFFIHEHFERFLTKAHGRYQPWYSFIPILLLGILPWITPMLDALARAWKADAPGQHFLPQRFLLIWSAFIFLFFSASSSKLPSYILPIFPALALLIAPRLAAVPLRRLFWMMIPIAVLAGVAVLLSPTVVTFADEEVTPAMYQGYAAWLAAAAMLWFAGNAIGLYLLRKNRRRAGLVVIAAAALAAGQLALSGYENLAPAASAYRIAEQIKPHLKPGIPFYSINMYEQTLPFYIQRTVTLVDHLDELEFGLQQEPEKWLPTVAEFEQAWRKTPEALAIMTPDTYTQFQQKGLPMLEIARDTRRIVVKKP